MFKRFSQGKEMVYLLYHRRIMKFLLNIIFEIQTFWQIVMLIIGDSEDASRRILKKKLDLF